MPYIVTVSSVYNNPKLSQLANITNTRLSEELPTREECLVEHRDRVRKELEVKGYNLDDFNLMIEPVVTFCELSITSRNIALTKVKETDHG